MLFFHPSRFGWILVLALGLRPLVAPATQADYSHEYHYHYISLSKDLSPSGFSEFAPVAIDDRGRIYGTIWDASFIAHIAVYINGAVTVFQPGNAVAANARGIIGGFVTDPQTGNLHAALFRGDQTEMIPFLPGEIKTYVLSLNDSDTALVWSEDPSGLNQNTYRLYRKGKTLFSYQLPTGSDCSSCWGVNNQGIVVGTIYDANLNAFRAIRFRPPYGEPLLLDPLPPDSDSTSFGINSSGYILGVSNAYLGDPSRNRYGVWNRKGNFKAYFEGINYYALFNDNNLIVLTQNFDTDFNSYLVPRPGVRLNVADLVDNPSTEVADLAQVIDINNRGDMIGYKVCFDLPCPPPFLLRRLVSPQVH